MKILDTLIKHRLVTTTVAAAVRDAATKTSWSPAALLLKAGVVDPAALATVVAADTQTRKVDLDKEKPDAATLMVIAPQLAYQRRVIPTWLREEKTGDSLYLAMTDPTDQVVFDALAQMRVRIIAYVADDAAIERALARYHPGRAPEAIPAALLQAIRRADDGIVESKIDDATEQGFLTTTADEADLQRVPGGVTAPAAAAPGTDDIEWLLQRQQEAGRGRPAGATPAPVSSQSASPPGSSTAMAPPPVSMPLPPPAGVDARRPLQLSIVLVGASPQRARVRSVLSGWFSGVQEADTFKAALGVAMTEHVDVFVLLDPAADTEGVKLLSTFLKRPKRPRVIAEGDDAGLPVDARLGRSVNELELGGKIIRALAHG